MGMSEPFTEFGEMIEMEFQSLTKEALSWFNDDEDEKVDELNELAKASAWYIVTNHKDYVSTDCVERNQLWSFPLCVYDRLVKIKMQTARNKTEVCEETH
ncbi:BnaC01g44710D [Brassica napus]|nr:BnaC01g44710D [Brassica napus]